MPSTSVRPKSPTRLKLNDVRRIFRLLAEIRCRGNDPAQWRPFMAKALIRIFGAEIVISSEIHLQPTAEPGSWDLVDVGWGADGSGAAWRIEHRHREENPQVYDVVVRDAGPGDGPAAIAPTRGLHGGSAFVMSSIALPHIHAIDQLGMHRAHGQPPFTAADHRLLRLLHVELARFWRRDVLARVRDPRQDLPPRLRQTLALLVEGKSEKEIGGAIGISPHTVHNYVKSLHGRFGVSSRGELIAAASASDKAFVPKLSVTVHPAAKAKRRSPLNRVTSREG